MGGSKTKSSQTSTTTIPAEIRERGTTITNAAMGQYFDPAAKYQPYGGSYAETGAATTGQLNGYHAQAGNQIGQAGQQFNQASQAYQPYYNLAGQALASGVNSTAGQFTGQTGGAGGYAGATGGASGYAGQTGGAAGYAGPTGGAQTYTGATNNAAGYTGQTGGASTFDGPMQTANQMNANANVNGAFTGPSNTAQGISNPNFSQAGLEKFFNPYQSNVIDQGVRRIQDEMTQGRLANQSRAASAGAFGGTRHAILDAENQNNAMTNLSDFVGSQLSQGYNQAVNQYNTDYGQQLQALSANNQAAGQNFNQGITQSDQNNRAYQANLQNAMNLNLQNNQAAGQNFNQSLAGLQFNNQAAGQNFNQGITAQQLANQAAGQNFNQGITALNTNNAAIGQNFNQGLSAQQLANQATGQNFNQGLSAQQLFNQALGQNFNQGLSAQQLANQALGQNFNQGLSALQTNNQAAGQNYNQSLSSANFLQGLGTANQQAGINAGNAMLQGGRASADLGNIYTAQDQAQKDNAYEKGYLDQRNYPMEIYERLAAMNAMQPVNRTSTSTGTQSQSGGWLGPALNAGGSILAMSDVNAKENIHERDPEDVLGAFAEIRPYEYTYKDSAREANPGITKPGIRRGFMAQDYERAHRRAVGPVTNDGFKAVDMANVLGDLVGAVHALEKRTRALKPKSKRGA